MCALASPPAVAWAHVAECVGSPLFPVEARALACLLACAGRLAGSVVKLLCGPFPRGGCIPPLWLSREGAGWRGGPCQAPTPPPAAEVCACSGAVFLPSSSVFLRLLASPEGQAVWR